MKNEKQCSIILCICDTKKIYCLFGIEKITSGFDIKVYWLFQIKVE